MKYKFIDSMLGLAAVAVCLMLCSCGSSGTSNSAATAQNGTVNMMVSDASTEDWATIGVKVLSISLVPQGGGTPVVVYTAPTPAPTINLVELDQLSEILGNAQVPAGTYTSASLTIGGNPGDVLLTTAADPEPGFAGAASTAIPAGSIEIEGTTGAAGSLTVPLSVSFVSPLVVTANQSNALDLEFDLSHPAFLVNHVPLGGGTTMWAVDFNGPVRHHPIADIRNVVLRHLYGTVTAVSTDNTSITITKDYPVKPPTTPETAIASSQSLPIVADSANGTIFYNVDAKTATTVTNFSSIAGTIKGMYVRVAARYQTGGTLVAVRVWASSSFNSVWLSPEGHVLHVDTNTDVVTVENESGFGVPVTVNANTGFFFRTPWNAVADAAPIATGTNFLSTHDLVRGFKVHVSVVDPLATPLVAQTVDIEQARYDGDISLSNTTNFTYTRTFNTASDNYVALLDYIANGTANGNDSSGNPILGFKWWNFTFPTVINDGSGAIASFVAATNGSVNFGGSVPALPVWGASYTTWADPANPTGWSARWAVLEPSPVPLATVSSTWASSTNGGSFSIGVAGGTRTVSVSVSSVPGSATLVYQMDRTGNVVTVSPQDLTTSGGLANAAANLAAGAVVKVFGVPQTDGSIKAYVVFYYTGTKPAV